MSTLSLSLSALLVLSTAATVVGLSAYYSIRNKHEAFFQSFYDKREFPTMLLPWVYVFSTLAITIVIIALFIFQPSFA